MAKARSNVRIKRFNVHNLLVVVVVVVVVVAGLLSFITQFHCLHFTPFHPAAVKVFHTLKFGSILFCRRNIQFHRADCGS